MLTIEVNIFRYCINSYNIGMIIIHGNISDLALNITIIDLNRLYGLFINYYFLNINID